MTEPMPCALFVDDDALRVDVLQAALSNEIPGLRLLHAGSLDEASAWIQREPHIRRVVLALAANEDDGLSRIAQALQRLPASCVLGLSADDHRGTVLAAVRAGAAGYLVTTGESVDLLPALRVVLAGGVWLPPAVIERRTPDRPGYGTWIPAAKSPADAGFSPVQADVLRCLIEGMPNDRTASRLQLPGPVVKDHLDAILRKLDATSRLAAVLAVARLGLRLGIGA